MTFEIVRADASSVGGAVPLLLDQMRDHRISVDSEELTRAVRALVEIPVRGAVLLAKEREVARFVIPEGGVVGVAVLAYTWTIEHGGPCAWLDELYVLPSLRDRGIGRALLLRALETARGDGARAVDLEVDVEHERAERLYEREGFESLPRRRWAKKLR